MVLPYLWMPISESTSEMCDPIRSRSRSSIMAARLSVILSVWPRQRAIRIPSGALFWMTGILMLERMLCKNIFYIICSFVVFYSVIVLRFVLVNICSISTHILKDHFVYVPNQWEATLQCNVVSHWLATYKKWSLILQDCIAITNYN